MYQHMILLITILVTLAISEELDEPVILGNIARAISTCMRHDIIFLKEIIRQTIY